MPRSEPRRFLQFLLNEWAVVDAIHEHTRRRPLRPRELRELAAQSSSPRIIDRLLEYGVVVPLPNSPAYEMGDIVQEIVAQLKNEHSLGLADELKVNLEDLDGQTAGIIAALNAPDHEKRVRHAEALQRRIKAIHRQLLNNGQALEEMVTRAKTRRRHVPLQQRYAEVLEAWDSYVEPIRIMVDPSGAFESLFERLERELQQALKAVVTHGGLVAEKNRLELLLFRLMHLRGKLRGHLSETSELLLPVVREVRANSVVARGASILLKRLRTGELEPGQLAQSVPLSRRVTPNVIAGREFIESYVAALSAYEPEPQAFFATADGNRQKTSLLDAEAALAELSGKGSVRDVMGWLVETYDDIADTDELLDLYMRAAAGGADGTTAVRGEKIRHEARNHFITAPQLTLKKLKCRAGKS